ncbi:MAG: N-acetyltransferase [Chloroflexi bacterium]|nr:MAG: N-acetyltransferase [Chloroflexota bacterium]
MQIHSLGYRTDLFFPRFEGIVLDRGEYTVILTPSNPDFYWGNYLLFSQPPAQGDLERWQALFEQEICSRQNAPHRVFGWDSSTGDKGAVEPFLAAGYNLSQGIVLTAREVTLPPKYNHAVVVRPLVEEWEWNQVLRNQVDCRPPQFTADEYRPFKTAKMARYREMQQAGLGAWFGAFLGDRLVADLGLFCIDGVARFQSVETVPEYRRQGICGTMVYQVANYGFEHLGAKKLVMIADEFYHAARIYESVGFRPEERQVGLEKGHV